MDAIQSLQFFVEFLCTIAAVMAAGTGVIIYLLLRSERRARVPRVHRPPHGLRALVHKH
jgi:hypothetical protein